MAQSAVKAYPNADVSISIVWIRMLPGDNEEAAREISRIFTDPCVRQFWDADRLSGITYSRDVFPRWLKEGVDALPPDHMLRMGLSRRAEAPPEQQPLWDIAMFYEKGVEWTNRPPTPTHWMKQIAYMGRLQDGTSGLFWKNDFAKVPVASDWFAEIKTGMQHLIGEDPNDG